VVAHTDIAIDYLNFTVCLSGGNVVIGNIDLNLTAVDKVVYLPGHTAAVPQHFLPA
jgi:hypothetical protein